MKLYKLTDSLTESDGKTRNDVYWGIGVTNQIRLDSDDDSYLWINVYKKFYDGTPVRPVTYHEHADSSKPKLCSNTVFHAYPSPLMAAMMHLAHVNYSHPRGFVVEGEVLVTDGTKVGSQCLTVVDTFAMPEITTNQRFAFMLLVSKKFFEHDAAWVEVVDAWLRDHTFLIYDVDYTERYCVMRDTLCRLMLMAAQNFVDIKRENYDYLLADAVAEIAMFENRNFTPTVWQELAEKAMEYE